MTGCVILELLFFVRACVCSLQQTYEAKRQEFVVELQRREDEMRQMFVQRVKEKESELKEAEREVCRPTGTGPCQLPPPHLSVQPKI